MGSVLIVAGPFNGLGGSGNLPLRKRGENLEGLWGELASSFTKLGGLWREASSLCTICNQAIKLYENPSCYGFSWSENASGTLGISKTHGNFLWTLPGSPLPDLAVAIGQVVSDVYNKVMNFPFVDRGDPRIDYRQPTRWIMCSPLESFDQEKQCSKRRPLSPCLSSFGRDSNAAQVHRPATKIWRGSKPQPNEARN
jgi:hypothetical protein